MSVERVIKYFSDRNMENLVFKLPESGATVKKAAETLHIEPKYVAKTLAFKVKEEDILVVTRGDLKISNRKFKDFFNVKAKMMGHDEVLNETGHPVGGLCPFGLLKDTIKIYIDVSIKNFEYVYPAAGSENYALKISPQKMQDMTSGQWVNVCKDPE